MNYKIVSNNNKLIEKTTLILKNLDMKEAIHIQEVDLYLVDVKTINEESLRVYKKQIQHTNILFLTNNIKEIEFCLENSFISYLNSLFSKEELISWCKYFFNNKKNSVLQLNDKVKIDFKSSRIINNKIEINLSFQEISLLKILSIYKYTKTSFLANSLNLNSTTSVRTIISRIRKKIGFDIFEQERSLGYKLKKKEVLREKKNPLIEELEEQNKLMQNVIDSSPIFIVTFIHKQLYCINKSFRSYLGNEIIKELWAEEKGDFFKLIKFKKNEKEEIKKELFSKGKHQIELYEINNKNNNFQIETFYFENLDKHLMMFIKNS